MEQLMDGKIPMPKTSDWKTSCGSWEGFCKTVRKSIAKNLGCGIIKFNKMTNRPNLTKEEKGHYNKVAIDKIHGEKPFRYNDDALVDAETINAYIEELEEAELEKDKLLKALKHLVIVAQKDEINKDHLDQALRKARNVIADIDPTVEKCDCCY